MVHLAYNEKSKKKLIKHPKYEDVMKGLKNTLNDSLTIEEFEDF